jgi:hypothetical protein
MKRGWFLGLVLTATASGIGASDGEPAPVYPSDATCRQWTAAADGVDASKRALQDAAYNYWIGGFLDGGSFVAGLNPPEPIERGAFVSDLFTYCEANPTSALPQAARLAIQRNWARGRK